MSENKPRLILKGRPAEGQPVESQQVHKMAKPVDNPLFSSSQIPRLLRPVMKVDLTRLIATGYVDSINVFQLEGKYRAEIVLRNNDIAVAGEGLNVLIAIDNLNKNILEMNFEF